MEIEKIFKDLNKQGYAFSLINNAQGYIEVLQAIQTKLNGKDREDRFHIVEEVFDGYFIYRASGGSEPSRLYRQNYSVSSSKVEFTGDPDEVKKEVSYVTLNNNRMSNSKKPCCLEKVVELINNKNTRFTTDDKEWLMTLEESQLKKLEPVEARQLEIADPPQVNKEQVMEAVREMASTAEEFINLMPAEIQDQMRSGLRLHNEHRAKLIENILTNTKDVWTEDELQAEDTARLEKISRGVKPVVDYSAGGAPVKKVQTNTSGGILLPPGVK